VVTRAFIVSRGVIRALLVLLLANSVAGEEASRPVSGQAIVAPASPKPSNEALRQQLEAELAEQQKRLRLLAVLETMAIAGCIAGIAAGKFGIWIRACGAAVPLGAVMIHQYLEMREITQQLHHLGV
jgi:hypothetical protein